MIIVFCLILWTCCFIKLPYLHLLLSCSYITRQNTSLITWKQQESEGDIYAEVIKNTLLRLNSIKLPHWLAMDPPEPYDGFFGYPEYFLFDCQLHILSLAHMVNSLKSNNLAAYELVMSMKNDQNGKKQLCMNTLYSDHRRALTSGNGSEARACR
ncbi:hypothetical protein AMELA_G00058100 [Ameiurus melas]|uniref:Uncharacterized protein n=1 Tax=Ameiurus melas TaxID=219545 RepID=A0A7J6B1H3_AMEME|nr:hypothetical protein AMELA_G00058100 [Ameiurus melas]